MPGMAGVILARELSGNSKQVKSEASRVLTARGNSDPQCGLRGMLRLYLLCNDTVRRDTSTTVRVAR